MSPARAASDPAVGVRREEREDDGLPRYVLRHWERRHEGVRCGITASDGGREFGLSTTRSGGDLLDSYQALGRATGFAEVAVPRQVHGTRVVVIQAANGTDGGTGDDRAASGPALRLPGDADGLATRWSGLLLAATAADCVPVYLLAPKPRIVGLLHAGWRGTAAGVLEAGLGAFGALGVDAADIRVHLGPAICGECYEVGADVLGAFGRPGKRGRLDLRLELASRAVSLGVQSSEISRSAWCTRCGGGAFHSHRRDPREAGRMAAYLGIEESAG